MNKLTLLSVVAVLFAFGCTKKKAESQQKINSTISMPESVNKENSHQINHQETNLTEYDLKYFFSNDSICNELLIKTLNKSKKYEGIPEKIDFKLILKNKITNSSSEIKGIAELTSPNESFLDENEPDAGAYFAADYNKNNTGYTINISLDIENFEACAISIITDSNKNLKDFENYLYRYPKNYILKRGNCK